MSTSGSKLTPLLSRHDLKFVCAQCCVKEKEITYSLKSVQHQCTRDLLLCRVKGGQKWRPVSRRPLFPNPSQYAVCRSFAEGFGCSEHRNRCNFARSAEEAAVWTIEKQLGLDHTSVSYLLAQSERGSAQPNKAESLHDLLETLDLKAVCSFCSTKQKKITYTILQIKHQCGRNLLLAKVKAKASNQWRPVAERPGFGNFGRNVIYQACRYFAEDTGCTLHGEKCSYARSDEEAVVWNFVRDQKIDNNKLIRAVAESKPVFATPKRVAEDIFEEFSGEFFELCKECFHGSPLKLTVKRWNYTCSADAAHTWNPVLVYHLSESHGKEIYMQVRPVPEPCTFEYCSHVTEGKPCWHEAGQCQSAHGEVEMKVWKAEKSGLSIRSHLLQLSRDQQTAPKPVSMYCKVCLLALSSTESFFKHCSSLEHAQLLSVDTTTWWRCRPPPHNRRAEFWLCDRPESCEYGRLCPKAHSEEELKEWLMRAAEEKDIRHNIEAQGLMCYGEKLLEEYRNSSNEVHIISEQVDDVSVSCDGDLTLECEQTGVKLQWKFQVDTERELVHVALLKEEPGASFSLGEFDSEPCIYSPGEDFLSENVITVSFTSINPGLYEQWLVLDFGMRPVLLRKLRVRVGQHSFADSEPPNVNCSRAFQSVERWHRGNRVIIPCLPRTEEQEELLKKYKPPQINIHYKPSNNSNTPLNDENYKDSMHSFLYDEERAEDEVVSRLNVSGEITMLEMVESNHFGMIKALNGELFCAVSIPCNLTPETSEGLVLRRSIQSGLIAPSSSNDRGSKVYEVTILQNRSSENQVYLQLSRKCCSDLKLESNETYQMEVQFQLNRHRFCSMHKAVDFLPDTKRVLPDLKDCAVPVNVLVSNNHKLNAKQQSAIDFITGDLNVRKSVAPLLIYGPFGTGKTYTLAVAARELTKQPQNKVLICTHTNSSADLYVRDHLHPFINKEHRGIRPIRIKANNQQTLFATDDITLKYCFLSEGGQFLQPTKAILDRHNVVITTTSMARHFHNLNLPDGYFTHILIDEAAQMLECEALMPLDLAGPNTRVVLAGDHMQMAPKLFSVDAHHRSNHTLLNRLFHYYQSQKCDAAQKSRIIFSENYRSTKDIVEFVSIHFYVGKEDVIKAAGNVPAHPTGHSLKFHHVRGECRLDTMSMSWYNTEEVAKVAETVQDILELWPSIWGTKDQSSICVLSEGFQVRQVRSALKRRNLGRVHVENIANVQGKQFRAIVMTAVQTRDSLKTSHVPGLELFSDARVLNTAMTRAQSQLVVVGDGAALSCFGACSKIWKSYIAHCIGNNSVSPEHFTKDFFEKDVKETAKIQRSEHVDEKNTVSDAILQQMRDEFEQQKTEYNSESLEHGNSDKHKPSYITGVNADLLELCIQQPLIYKHGQFVRESFNKGYVAPSDSPSRHIRLTGKEALGKAFTGDEVVVHVDKVIAITKEEESARLLMCYLEDEDHSKPNPKSDDKFVQRTMIPITKNAPKIRILLLKTNRNSIPIWEQTDGEWTVARRERLDEHLKQTHVFMVQVIGWKEQCLFPLGRVVDIFPIGRSVEDGLRLLKEEFKVRPNMLQPCGSDEGLLLADKDEKIRQNLHEIITFTVDPEKAEALDDAISVKNFESRYELGVHIADVASFVSPGSTLDDNAKQRGVSYYCSKEEPIHMFPKHLSIEKFSLLQGEDRRVVSLIFNVTKETHKIIGTPHFQLSLIKSNRQLSYEEAEGIISSPQMERGLCFDTEEDCLRVAYHFSKAQRKERLQRDWAYAQTENDRLPGKRKAHLMIEELSVLFNKYVSENLISAEKTSSYTPLRCQQKPDPEKIKEFNEKCGEFIPLSFHVRYRVDHDMQDTETQNTNSFCILTKVWNDIQSAARTDDIDKVVDLVAADDIHPQLMSVVSQFKKCCSKAYVIRSNSSPRALIGHYSLNVTSYTNASSPIRRYIDVVLQRLLHTVICDSDVQYSVRDIEALCYQFELNSKKAKEYEQKAEKIFYAVSMRRQNTSKIAFIVSAEPMGDSFTVSFPFNGNIFADNLSIMYRDLQLEDQPLDDPLSHRITLKWRKRIYSAKTKQIHQELTRFQDCGPCTVLPIKTWKAIGEAVDTGNWEDAKSLIMEANAEQLVREKCAPKSVEAPQTETDTPTCEEGHYVELDFQFQRGDTLQIQMTSEVNRCYHTPVVQLVQIKPKFEICVDHIHNPAQCFTRSADDPPRLHYSDTNEYKRIWLPLCKMESAASAVEESESIIIEDLVVNFHQEQDGMLTGSFILPLAWINEWAIECNLANCLLCIRKRGLELMSAVEHSTQVDPNEFTWVAHGVTHYVEDPKKTEKKVEFHISHLPMEKIPLCVFQKDTQFTVEIIPKLLPDIRKENAVIRIGSACDVVQNIALGQHILKEAPQYNVQRWQLINEKLPDELPALNKSQYEAVEKALENAFTLIQGPPGTGKTVVGVYIVHWFFKMNNQCQRRFVHPKDQNKKDVILYCGPSNKSVDVVAEFLMLLMKVKDSLRPLRMYSQQVEMLEYPYPGCNLQFSQRTLRQEFSKPELRSITLHHRMRQDPNPFAPQINDFDHRIQLALQKSGPELTAEEVTEYKKNLIDARKYELERHDVILCTCTVSSTSSLTQTVSARQILIDECAMATEPQALIPLVCNNPEKIVLIGDHKQLNPIVKSVQVTKLGMAKSLFERYFTIQHKKRTVRLDTQYRMHEDICEFPSKEYYDGELKTGVKQPNSVLLADQKPTAIVFGDICGKAVSLIVKTAKGNEKSRANREERDKVIEIAEMLVKKAEVEQQNIVILSPYNAQVSEIRERLKEKKMDEIRVTTITKSQGSEWRYVIISTVCSLPSDEIEQKPDRAWLSKHLGFLGNPNQINVGITRAKEGLCIIGNQEMLSCSAAWKNLLQHYTARGVVTKAEKISVARQPPSSVV